MASKQAGLKQLLYGAVCGAGLLAAGAAMAEGGSFASPYQNAPATPRATAPLKSCPKPPPPVRDLPIESGFVPGEYTKMVPARVAARQTLTEPLHAYLGKIVDLSGRSMMLKAGARDVAANCVMSWLETWLAHGAMLGEISNEGQYERESMLIALGLSAMQSQAGQGEVTAPAWLTDWFMAATEDLAQRYALDAPTRNNHWYWAGLASIVAGTIAGDAGRYEWGLAQYQKGLDDIDADGFLPLELKRGGLALQYNAFAAGALVTIAAFEHANGRPLDGANREKLQRLVQKVLLSLADPAEIERRASAIQQPLDPGAVRMLSWMEIYHALTGDVVAEPWLRHLRPMRVTWLGGDVTAAFGTRLPVGPIVVSPLIKR